MTLQGGPNLSNPYKDNKKIKHSLFQEKDSQDRMSIDRFGVPEKIGKAKISKVKEPEKIVAARIVEYYRKIFDYLDYKPVDDLINADELSEAFRDFNWPKAASEVTDDFEYAQVLIKKYDKGGKNALNFVEFCKLMEELWGAADNAAQGKCNQALAKAQDIFERLFRWLDRDQDGLISPHDMIYGISRIMIRDADIDEINKIFAQYDPKKTGKINRKSYLLAMSNGMLKKSLKNEQNTGTLEK